MERCRECGRVTTARPFDDDDNCPVCGGELQQVRIAIRDELPQPPTRGEELVGRLLGIGA